LRSPRLELLDILDQGIDDVPRFWLLSIRRLSCRLVLGGCLLVLLAAGVAPGSTSSARAASPIVVVKLNTEIDQISDGFLKAALKHAAKEHARLVIIEINTPGGLINSMRNMVGYILASPVPVAAYVQPQGARAASAGTLIAASTAFLAMAPGTNIGAAAVVGSAGQSLPSTEGKKVTNDIAALMRSVAEQRHRPVRPLVDAIRKAASYSSQEAVKLGIANLQTPDLDTLIQALNGRQLETVGGPVVIHTRGAPIETAGQTLLQRILRFLADPNLVFLLLSLGGLGLIVELWSGGSTWIPGSLGAIFLVLAFVGIGSLPFSWAGLLLILIGIVFLGFEIHAPGHLFFGAAGTASLILGGIYLLGGAGVPQFGGAVIQVSRWLLFLVAFAAGGIVLVLAHELRKSRRLVPYISPLTASALVGSAGEVSVRLSPAGEVHVAGEAWQAELSGGGELERGKRVRVERVEGLKLFVTTLPQQDNPPPNESAPTGA
jgi:membrane-bound serine protease (ClpP class)